VQQRGAVAHRLEQHLDAFVAHVVELDGEQTEVADDHDEAVELHEGGFFEACAVEAVAADLLAELHELVDAFL